MLTRLAHRSEMPFSAELFAGTWNVARKVIDHRAAAIYSFAGQAILTGGIFEERGEVVIGQSTLQAVRTYKLEFEAASVRVAYPSGSDFIQLELRPAQSVHHLCGNDTYNGRFFFRSANEWVEFWRVNGPQKRYASLTRYQRVIGH